MKNKLMDLRCLENHPRDFARVSLLLDQHFKRVKLFAYGAIWVAWLYFIWYIEGSHILHNPERYIFIPLLGFGSYFVHRKFRNYEKTLWSEYGEAWETKLKDCGSKKEAKTFQAEFVHHREELSRVILK